MANSDRNTKSFRGIIYLLTCRTSGKIYVGQTTKPTAIHRWRGHVVHANLRLSTCHLHRAIRKYGAEAFDVSEIACASSAAALNELETYFIKSLRSYEPAIGYNMTFGGDAATPTEDVRRKLSDKLRGRKLSPEQCRQMSIRNKGKVLSGEHKASIARGLQEHYKTHEVSPERRRAISLRQIGHAFSAETRKAISLANTGRKPSAEARAKMSMASTGRPNYWKGKPKPREIVEKWVAGTLATIKAKSKELLAYYPAYEAGESLNSISKRTGIRDTRLKRAFRYAGLPTRTRSESANLMSRQRFGVYKKETHGVLSCYQAGCRCDECRRANAEAGKKHRDHVRAVSGEAQLTLF